MLGARVLIVEDENIVAMDIEVRLRGLGYEVAGTVPSGEEAIEFVRDSPPDLILMDIMLKGKVDGVEATSQIRKISNIPVIFITAYSDEATLNRAKVTEPFGYLLKPFEERELHITIEIALYRHKIETQLKDHEQWLQTILQSIGDGIIATDRDRKIKFMNPVAEVFYGSSNKENFGKRFDRVIKFTKSRTSGSFKPLDDLEIREKVSGEGYLVPKGHKPFPIEFVASRILDELGAIVGYVMVFRDISERKKSQRAIILSEKRYRTLFESNPHAMFVVDDECKFLAINAAAFSSYGYTGEEFLQMGFENLFEHALAEGDDYFSGIHQHHSKERKVIDVEVRSQAIRWNGKPARLVFVDDITERVKAQRNLVESEERYRNLVDYSPDGIAIHVDGELTFANQALATILGAHDLSEILGRKVLDFVHPDFRQKVIERVKNLTVDGLPVPNLEEKFVRLDGTTISVEVTGMPFMEGSRRAVQLVIRDVSDRVKAERELKHSEIRYRSLFENSPLPMWVYDVESLKFLAVNDAAVDMYGYTKEEFLSMTIMEIRSKRERERLLNVIEEHHKTSSIDGGTWKHKRKDGSTVFVEVSTHALIWDRHNGRMVLVNDVTQRLKAERELKKSEERFRSIIEDGSDAIVLVDKKAKILYAAPSLPRVTGYDVSDVIGKNVASLIHPGDYEYIRARFLKLTSGPREVMSSEFRLLNKYGEWRWYEGTAKNLLSSSHVNAVVLNFRDITERKTNEEQIRRLAFYDQLTGLPNRTLLYDRLSQSMRQSNTTGWKVGVIFIDLDRFKNINDSLGHHMGDKVLQAVGKRFSESVRNTDTVSHTGGDEFIIILPDLVNVQDIIMVVEKLMLNMSMPYNIDNRELFITASLGISIYPNDSDDMNRLIMYADAAMYTAKQRGGNGYQFYTTDMNEKALEWLEVENGLRQALNADQLKLYFQPKLNLKQNVITGAETLTRWFHPEKGYISPLVFIPAAEEGGFIDVLGKWSLLVACKKFKELQKKGVKNLRVAVNVSAIEFRKNYVETVKEALSEAKLNPRYLELEITETEMMLLDSELVGMLNELKSLGIRITIDDFGTGYSSLSRLRSLPIDALKIDQYFIEKIPHDANTVAIVKAILALAQSLKLKTVAEGVETQSQVDFLRKNGCDEIQGYIISKPVSADEFDGVLGNKL